jgi:hypothetical protein
VPHHKWKSNVIYFAHPLDTYTRGLYLSTGFPIKNAFSDFVPRNSSPNRRFRERIISIFRAPLSDRFPLWQLWKPITLKNPEDGDDTKNAIFWDVTPSGSCKNRRIGERSASIIMVTICEVGTMLAVTSSRRTLRRKYTNIVPSSSILFTLMMKALSSPETSDLTRAAPHYVTSQKTAFFIVTAVKTSNLTWWRYVLWNVGSNWSHTVQSPRKHL